MNTSLKFDFTNHAKSRLMFWRKLEQCWILSVALCGRNGNN